MEYITSRSFELPTNPQDMESGEWFNMWKDRQFPYKDLSVGDILYWLDITKKRMVWKTEVTEVERYPYPDKKAIIERYGNDNNARYLKNRPDSGYFVGYKVKVLEHINIPKPDGFDFVQLGWMKVNYNLLLKWPFKEKFTEDTVLDDMLEKNNKNILDLLAEINEKMQDVSPEIVKKLVKTTIRKDTAIVNSLKIAVNFKCQFPGCGIQIPKKDGGFYIEVAHIKPVAEGGKSILGNLLVLCPNHHKEFDHGEIKEPEQTLFRLAGILNGNQFEIDLTHV